MYKWGSNSCSHVVWQLGEAALQKDFLDFDFFLVKNRLSRSWHLIFHQLWVVHSLSLAFVELCDPNFTDAVVCHPRWGELRWFQHLEIQGYGGLEIISLGLWGCWRWWFYHVFGVFFKKIARRPTGTTGIYIRTQAIEFRWSWPATNVMNVSVLIYNEITLVPCADTNEDWSPAHSGDSHWFVPRCVGTSYALLPGRSQLFVAVAAKFVLLVNSQPIFKLQLPRVCLMYIHMSSMARLKPNQELSSGHILGRAGLPWGFGSSHSELQICRLQDWFDPDPTRSHASLYLQRCQKTHIFLKTCTPPPKKPLYFLDVQTKTYQLLVDFLSRSLFSGQGPPPFDGPGVLGHGRCGARHQRWHAQQSAANGQYGSQWTSAEPQGWNQWIPSGGGWMGMEGTNLEIETRI